MVVIEVMDIAGACVHPQSLSHLELVMRIHLHTDMAMALHPAMGTDMEMATGTVVLA